GLWPEDTEQMEPASAVSNAPEWGAAVRYAIGTETCSLLIIPGDGQTISRADMGGDGRGVWVQMRGNRLRWWVVLESTRYPQEAGTWRWLPADPPLDLASPPAVDI